MSKVDKKTQVIECSRCDGTGQVEQTLCVDCDVAITGGTMALGHPRADGTRCGKCVHAKYGAAPETFGRWPGGISVTMGEGTD